MESETKKQTSVKKQLLGGIIFVVAYIVAYSAVHFLFTNGPTITAEQNTQEYFSQDSEWKTFNSTIGQFQIQFPTYPTQTPGTFPSTATNPEVSYTEYDSKDSNGDYYTALVSTYPDSVDVSNPKANLEGSLNGSVASTKGTLVSSSFTTYENQPTVDYLIQTQNYYVKVRAILVAHTLYVMEVISPSNGFSSFDKFVNSLEFK